MFPVVVWLKYENHIPFNHTQPCVACEPNRKYTKKIQFNHLHNEIMYTLNDGNVFIAVVAVVIVARTTKCVRATSKNKQYKIIITAVLFLQEYGNLLSFKCRARKNRVYLGKLTCTVCTHTYKHINQKR